VLASNNREKEVFMGYEADDVNEIRDKLNQILETCTRFGFFNTVFWFGLGVGAGVEIIKQIFSFIKKLL
jgi:hypothetical protein